MNVLATSPAALIIFAALIGLMVGSFLNVVIYRLPIMMQQSWRRECQEFLELPADPPDHAHFSLVLPSSHCPQCKHPVKIHQNIPVFSYLFLSGKCAACNSPISKRYLLIETLTALASVIVVFHFGFTAQAFLALLLTWGLVALSFIDMDHHLLPDTITLPFLWLGLLSSTFNVFTDPVSSIIGAAAGYLVLWIVYHLFKLATGKEGMGYGDFKLLALFGAWLGWSHLPLIVILASLTGTVVGVALVLLNRHDRQKPIPFGPFLAITGWIALLWGEAINQFYLTSVGL